jgi:probable HAF family extracellular repeat protein
MKSTQAFLLYVVSTTILCLAATVTAQTYTVTDLGTLGGNQSNALGINDVGQVVGYSWVSNGRSSSRAFLWGATTGMRGLGTLGGSSSIATAINNSAQVVGCSEIATWAFIWTQAEGMQKLDAPIGSIAYAINDSGTVVGTFAYSSLGTHAFLWTAAGEAQDLGSLGGGVAEAYGINASGAVVGTSLTAPSNSDLYPAFLWTSVGGMKRLHSLITNEDGRAVAINSNAEIVGFALYKSFIHAVMWDALRQIYDLNQLAVNSPLILIAANGVNSKGQIIGPGRAKSNAALVHAFLATPAK